MTQQTGVGTAGGGTAAWQRRCPGQAGLPGSCPTWLLAWKRTRSQLRQPEPAPASQGRAAVSALQDPHAEGCSSPPREHRKVLSPCHSCPAMLLACLHAGPRLLPRGSVQGHAMRWRSSPEGFFLHTHLAGVCVFRRRKLEVVDRLGPVYSWEIENKRVPDYLMMFCLMYAQK